MTLAGLGAPWWLLALLVVPLIHWLHKWRAPVATVPVSALFLWDEAGAPSPGADGKNPPEKAWRRRALIAVLLALALAAPWTPVREAELTVWIDDSASMATIENGMTRLAAALDELGDALDEPEFASVTLRSLTNPARAYDVTGTDVSGLVISDWPIDRHAEVSLPALLPRDRVHWLLTDGADEQVVEWATRAGIARVFQSGIETENVAITRVAARRRPGDNDDVDVLVSVENPGLMPADRNVTVSIPSAQTLVERVTVPAGGTYTFTARVPTAPSVVAVVSRGDALALDDELRLDTSVLLPTAVAIDASCPGPLQKALRVHPGLSLQVDASDVELRVICDALAKTDDATLWFRPGPSTPVADAPLWLPAAGALQDVSLDAAWLSSVVAPVETDSDRTILLAGGRPLVVQHDDAPRIEVRLDMAKPGFAAQPEYAAFVAGLVDAVLGRDVLDPVVATATTDASIAPQPISLPAGNYAVASEGKRVWSDWLIALALSVLLVDIALLVNVQQRVRHG